MEFWTVMLISYGTAVMGSDASLIPYPSVEDCGNAIMPVYDTLHADFPDLMIQCVETQEVSNSLRPMPRPEGLK